MKKFWITLSLLLTLGLSASGVAAQVDAPDLEETMDEAYDVEGLVSVYDRTFSVDFEAMMASPEADLENLDFSAMMRMISIQGITFDSEDSASAYVEQMNDELDSQADADMEMMESVEINELEGFDVDGLRITMEMPDLEAAASIVFFADGNYVFQVMVMDADIESAESRADAVVQFVLDANVENDEVTFNMDGTSTGGVFDRMPTGDDEIVGDLNTVTDSELLLEDAE